jgi:PEP-CTERM motif
MRIVTIALAALLLSAAPARADLIDLGNGMIYDPLQDLTWMQNASVAPVFSGRDPYPAIFLWVSEFEFGGYDDWRLPTAANGSPASEIFTLIGQFGFSYQQPNGGFVQYLDPYGNRLSSTNCCGPFYNIGLTYTDTPFIGWDLTMGMDPTSGIDVNSGHVWAVRDGRAAGDPNLAVQVPEPSSLLALGVGLLLALRQRR